MGRHDVMVSVTCIVKDEKPKSAYKNYKETEIFKELHCFLELAKVVLFSKNNI